MNRTRSLIRTTPECYHKFLLENRLELRKILRKVRGPNETKIKRKKSINKKEEYTFFPDENLIFRSLIDLSTAKFVIIGQDPYHNGAAEGLSFSVKKGFPINASLRNIFKEISNSYPEKKIDYKDGNLEYLVKQGGILLNTSLTVEKASANSHRDLWYPFTIKLLKFISKTNKNLVYILLGNEAKSLERYIGENYKAICTAAHPVAFGGFFHSDVFKNANESIDPKVEWCNKEYKM